MSKSYEFGRIAEDIAEHYLEGKGYTIVSRNIRIGKAEIDIIAMYDQTLVIVEVKARNSTYFESPVQAVNHRKISLLSKAAHKYVIDHGIDKEVRFDIISIVKRDKKWRIDHIEDAFFPG